MDERQFIRRAENSNKSSAGPLKLLFSGHFFLNIVAVAALQTLANAGTLAITLVMFRHRDHAVTLRK